MEIEVEAYRRIDRLVTDLADDVALETLADLEIDPEIPAKDRVEWLIEKYQEDWTVAQYKTLWAAAEISNFFSSWVNVYYVKPQKISLRATRQKIKHEEHFNNDNMIALEMYSKPHMIFLARTPKPYRSMADKTITSEDIRDSLYWFPQLGIALTKFHEDKNGDLFKKLLEDQLLGEMDEFRIKSMIITKLFNNERYVKQLVVSAMAQITGFDGLDEIRFIGPDVKRGLGGLYRRQDIRVHLHEIGPNLAAESKNLHLRIGTQLKVKTIDGIYELHMLMYSDMYPSDSQLSELKEKLETDKKIKIKDLAKDWKMDEFNVRFKLEKEIELNNIKAELSKNQISAK